MVSVAIPRRKCDRCGVNRQLRFFGPDARRKDELSTVCTPCKKGKRSLGNRNQRLQDTYGITEAEYQALLAAQGGVCAICGGSRKVNLDVDHSHAMERAGAPARETVRGLACRRCNRRLLPAAMDSVEVLISAIQYLLDPPAPKVLQ